jgi:hypothetical protein
VLARSEPVPRLFSAQAVEDAGGIGGAVRKRVMVRGLARHVIKALADEAQPAKQEGR